MGLFCITGVSWAVHLIFMFWGARPLVVLLSSVFAVAVFLVILLRSFLMGSRPTN